jgi:renalase
MVWDVVVIGAGVSGLVCGQRLHQAGYGVLVLEKSRGLGGRAATRRLENACADHGLRYLEPQGELTQDLIEWLLSQEVVQPWVGTAYQWELATGLMPSSSSQRYVAPQGMNGLGKALAVGLDIWRGQRVVALTLTGHAWSLTLDPIEGEPLVIDAKAVVLAIPAPQAEALVTPIAGDHPEAIAALKRVKFAPCISAIAHYASDLDVPALLSDSWQSIQLIDHPELSWVSRETSKRRAPGQTVMVLHSTPTFAARHLETNALPEIGMQLFHAASHIAAIPALAHPTLLQVHRWRYAIPSAPHPDSYLAFSLPMPLVCCGDWADGANLEAALRSGAAAADPVNHQLHRLSLPESNVWRSLKQVDISTPAL